MTELARTLMDLANKKADFAVSPELGLERKGLTELCQSFAPYFDGALPGLDSTLQDLTLLDSTLGVPPGLYSI